MPFEQPPDERETEDESAEVETPRKPDLIPIEDLIPNPGHYFDRPHSYDSN